jgi:hypothetical protein
MSIFSRIFFLGLVLLLLGPVAFPCTCDWQATGWNARDSLRKAKAVFLGEVTAVSEGRERDPIFGGMYVYVEFKVERFWKGTKGPFVNVWAMVPQACGGPRYEVGQSYLVYAYPYGEAGKELETSGCARSRVRKHADQDLLILGRGKVPKTREGKPSAH